MIVLRIVKGGWSIYSGGRWSI